MVVRIVLMLMRIVLCDTSSNTIVYGTVCVGEQSARPCEDETTILGGNGRPCTSHECDA